MGNNGIFASGGTANVPGIWRPNVRPGVCPVGIDFSDMTGTGWVNPTYESQTYEADLLNTMNVMAPATAISKNKLITATAATNIRLEKTFTAADWQNKNFAIAMYFHEGTKGTLDSYRRLVSAGGGVTGYIRMYAGANNRIFRSIGGTYNKYTSVGWNVMTFSWEDHYVSSTLDAAADIDKVLFGWNLNSLTDIPATGGTTGPKVTMGGFYLLPKVTKPMVCITFDDIIADQLPLVRYANAKGIPVTLFATVNWVGGTVASTGYDRLTLSQLEQCHRAGNLIANHSVTHAGWDVPPDQTGGLSEAQCIQEVVGASQWLTQHGFGDGARIFASPVGGCHFYGSQELWKYMDCIRTTRPSAITGDAVGFRGCGYVPFLSKPEIPTATYDLTYGEAPADALTRITGAGANFVSLNHKFDDAAGYMSVAEMVTFIDAVAAGRDAGTWEVGTMADLLRQKS